MSSPNTFITNGQDGGTYIGGTALTTGQWRTIQVLADAKFHTLAGTIAGGIDNTTSGSAPTIAAGIVLAGNFSQIQLHSGAVVAYR
jgi:hypothetical protein